MIFETPHNEIECVLSVKESNFNEKKRKKCSHLLMVRADVADPPTPLVVYPWCCLIVGDFTFDNCLLIKR